MNNHKTLKDNSIGLIIWKFIAYVIMIIFSLLAIVPIIWLFINSFKSTVEFRSNMVGWPKNFTFKNYIGAWKIGSFSLLLLNSIFYTISSVVIAAFLSLLTGFAFAKIPRKETKVIHSIFVIGLLLTTQTLMVPLFLQITQLDSLLATLFNAPNSFHLFYNTRFGVILVYVGSLLPLGVYLCTSYIRSLPTALMEAGLIDGAGYFKIFLLVIAPMCTPILMTLALFNIPTIWNEFALINIMVSSTKYQTLPLGIYKFSGTLASDYGKEFAALIIGLMPMLIFYLIFKKQITTNVGSGAIKG
ncbi:MAG: carbohydrate ABC transporter permease [Spirochaetales bacterium]|nr:carbohydrate ABC transporter permease [Spirochaetales bacterium]